MLLVVTAVCRTLGQSLNHYGTSSLHNQMSHPPSRLLALSPSVDLSLTKSLEHYHAIVTGLLQVWWSQHGEEHVHKAALFPYPARLLQHTNTTHTAQVTLLSCLLCHISERTCLHHCCCVETATS